MEINLELTLAVFPHIKIQRIISSHCEAAGLPQFLLEPGGPASELSAQKWPSPPGLTELRESLCGHREPQSLLPSRHSAAARREQTGRDIICSSSHCGFFFSHSQYCLFLSPHRQESCWRRAVRGQEWADGWEGLCEAVQACR